MKGLSTSLVFFSLMFFLNQGNPIELFNELRDVIPPAFQIFFDYEKSHTDLIDHFKNLMNDMAPSSQIEGSTLSEVIFVYLNFDPFSRRQGKEISQDLFTTEVRSSIQKMKNTKVEADLVSLQDNILELMNGVIKSSFKFDLKVLDDIFAELSQEANNIDPSDDFRKAIFDDLVKYSHETVNLQAKNYKEVKDLVVGLLKKVESILINLILFTYQPTFKESYLEAYKLRAFEICDLLFTLYHYWKVDYNPIFARVRNIQQDILTSTRSLNGIKFNDIDNSNAHEFNRRIKLIVDEQKDILRLIIPNNKIQRIRELRNLRMKVKAKETDIQKLKGEKNNLV